LSLRAVDDEIQLIQRLQDFCRQSGKQVEVYFDQAPAGLARVQSFGRVKVKFVRMGRTADEAIMARLQGLARSAKNWIVVSSDRQVQAAARASQAKVISSDEFAGYLTLSDQDLNSDPGVNVDISLDDSEIDEWLTLFGEEE
jgi:predicted RNA-binding protein with PIN domain